MLKQFEEKKETILKVYDKMLSQSKVFDGGRLSKIQEKKENLKKEKFFVAVAGQMKVGKSTLLNALIFQDEVLPVAATVQTAKITFLKYGEQNRIVVSLYSVEEMEEVQLSGTEKDQKEMCESITRAMSSLDVADYSEILAKRIIERETLDSLGEFVGKNGAYTPFIKSVTVYTPNEWLKNVIVVDTPGTNDPNTVRDKLTKEWIGKADAVVYCTYASSAMDATDFRFIDDYLSHIPSKIRLFAVTKKDTISSEEELKTYIDKDVIHGSFNKERDLIREGNVYFVAQCVALVKRMIEQDRALPQHLKEVYSSQKRSWWYEKDGLDTLEKAIEKTLIQNSEKSLLESHQSYIKKLYEKLLRTISKDIESVEGELEACSMDNSKIEAELKIIEESRSEIEKIFKELNSDVHKVVKDKITPEIIRELNELKGSIQIQVQRELENFSSLKILKFNYTGIIKEVANDEFDNKIRRKFTNILKKAFPKLESKFDQLFKVLEKSSFSFKVLRDEIKDMAKTIVDEMEFENLEIDFKEVKKKMEIHWYNSGKLNLYRGGIIGMLRVELNTKLGRSYKDILEERVLLNVENFIKEIEDDVNSRLEKYEIALEQHLKNKTDIESQKEKLEKSKDSLSMQEREIQSELNQIEAFLEKS